MHTIFLNQDSQSFRTLETNSETVGALASEIGVSSYTASVNTNIADDSTSITQGDVVAFVTRNKTGGYRKSKCTQEMFDQMATLDQAGIKASKIFEILGISSWTFYNARKTGFNMTEYEKVTKANKARNDANRLAKQQDVTTTTTSTDNTSIDHVDSKRTSFVLADHVMVEPLQNLINAQKGVLDATTELTKVINTHFKGTITIGTPSMARD